MTFTRSVIGWVLVCTVSAAGIPKSDAQILGGEADAGSSTQYSAPRMDPDVKQTAWPSIPLPRVTMPKVTMPDMSLVTTPIKSGYSKVTAGTKKAWEGTKEIFTFGRGDSQAAARPQNNESIWKRMFTSEPDKKDGPQTVAEWMAQPRLEP